MWWGRGGVEREGGEKGRWGRRRQLTISTDTESPQLPLRIMKLILVRIKYSLKRELKLTFGTIPNVLNP